MSTRSSKNEELDTKSNGLFSEKDWKCNLCGNINWAKRSHCNLCNASKPGFTQSTGSREGRGGGYMERPERIEYKSSRDDSEWDDFGRRKKKKNTIVEKETFKSTNKEDIEEDEDGEDDGRWDAWNDILQDEAKPSQTSKVSSTSKERENLRSSDDNSRKSSRETDMKPSKSRYSSGYHSRSRSPAHRRRRSRSRSRSQSPQRRRRSRSRSRSRSPYRSRHSTSYSRQRGRSRSRSPHYNSSRRRGNSRSRSRSKTPTKYSNQHKSSTRNRTSNHRY
ncbi:hypothetical protein K7432_008007 [Basidiobolus ranarum]|uniref:RanBP2-type domain-containing protein n=1 Tax=Basidiobolus ranarum TaxID=34480 RepID=A0ABR2WSI7_9FUNG